MTGKTVYLAGPEVFLPDGDALGARKEALAIAAGFTPLSPTDRHVSSDAAAANLSLSPTGFSRMVYRGNVDLMRQADFGIFDLTPFRGPSADVGTVFELGLMTGLGKPVFGYTNIPGDYIDRVAPRQNSGKTLPITQPPLVFWIDADGCIIENFGNADNLMIDSALAAHGDGLVRAAPPLPQRWSSLDGFADCLKQAAAWFASAAAATG
ncbi:MAG: nucleoside 2-deoxyribosyltransferase [Alphaproteobacteria bacterium PA4]|nr:MAG: nucleoside 2-deoxyribosyltransferase [Alphaproteobacteria bacterium PA4]